jgi:predicted ATPase
MVKAIYSEAFLLDVSLIKERVSSFEDYPFSIPVIKSLDKIEFHPKVTFFVGENGAGKSTLLEALAISIGLNPEGGSRNFNFASRESHSSLHECIRVAKGVKRPKDAFFLRAESLFNVGTEIERLGVLDSYGYKSLHEQSHGESFLSLMIERFFGNGIYLLDEPEAALSPTRQLSALRRIHDLVKDNSQFIICTHSPIMMAYPDSWIYLLNEEGCKRVDYKETEHYEITRGFLNRPEMMLASLLDE